MEVLAGFLLGFILGSEAGETAVPAMKAALGQVGTSSEVQSATSGAMATAQGLFGNILGDKAMRSSVKDALGTMASSEEVRSIVTVGFGTAQELALGLFGRGKELADQVVASQQGRGLRLVN
ncbi:MAG: hypothetical protein M3N98_00345 [Actinomycetota bacterium]|nr:hypothetical protein [Actinomycetota bacterium]